MKKPGEFIKQKESNKIRQIIFDKAKLANAGAKDQWVTVGDYRCLLSDKMEYTIPDYGHVYILYVNGKNSNPVIEQVFPRRKTSLETDENGKIEDRFHLGCGRIINKDSVLCYIKEMHKSQ